MEPWGNIRTWGAGGREWGRKSIIEPWSLSTACYPDFQALIYIEGRCTQQEANGGKIAAAVHDFQQHLQNTTAMEALQK